MSSVHFRSVGLIGKSTDPVVARTLRSIHKLLGQRGVDAWVENKTARDHDLQDLQTADWTTLAERCDLAITVGGDGTLLNAVRVLAEYDVPVLGVNLGRLGFLADVSLNDTAAILDQILGGEYAVEERLILNTQIHRNGEILDRGSAFNDVVVHKWEVTRMIEFETYIDGRFLNSHRSDGLIVATPTGSTAYALSAGGPILHPSLDALVIVTICPHTLSIRPIAVDANSEIQIVINERHGGEAQVTSDGELRHRLDAGDRVVIRRRDRKIRLIHPVSHDYYEILRAKLAWGRLAV